MNQANPEHRDTVTMTRLPMEIPTYLPHEPDRHPLFYEGRNYQGASGRVFPIRVADRLRFERTERSYDAITLENRYLRVVVLPELGGRIHAGLDKTNGYDFIYCNHVIKPALIGLAGPWVSGGIEFNWPQHHRPTTFMPLDAFLEEGTDGSRTVWVGETEPLYGMRAMAGITLHPGRSCLRVRVRAYNPTPFPQPFMWWANLGVPATEGYRILFPPDIRHVASHDRAFISPWPQVEVRRPDGSLYETCDGSWYRNHRASGSFMAVDGGSDFGFFQGYDTIREAGVVHVADPFLSSGKKLFTWGNSEFAEAWSDNLTDGDGPYLELMTGVYTDNQPDFSWILPHETRTFVQCWYPVQAIGPAVNASEDAAVSLDLSGPDIRLGFHATGDFRHCRAVLSDGERVVWDQRLDLDPAHPFTTSRPRPEAFREETCRIALYAESGTELVSYSPGRIRLREAPQPRTPAPGPATLATTEALFLHGLHLEQYRHHSLDPAGFYREALRRDPGDARCNTALGRQCLQRGLFGEAEAHFARAVERLTLRNPNPHDGEPLYLLGLAHCFQGREEDARRSFGKAAWNDAWVSAACQALAELDCRRQDLDGALAHVDRALSRHADSNRSRNLKAAILRRQGRHVEAAELAADTLRMDPLDAWALAERRFACLATGDTAEGESLGERLRTLGSGRGDACLDLVLEYLRSGLHREAGEIPVLFLRSGTTGTADPRILYAAGFLEAERGDPAAAAAWFRQAETTSPGPVFPGRLEEIAILLTAARLNPAGARAHYYLGNLYYDRRRYDDAIAAWERCRDLDGEFAPVHRNLALAYFDRKGDTAGAVRSMERAFALDGSDPRLLFELVQVYKNASAADAGARLSLLADHALLAEARDDCHVEWMTLLLQAGRLEEAAARIGAREYSVYEGGEGRLAKIHEWIHLLQGIRLLSAGRGLEALGEILSADVLPKNFHEGRGVWHARNHIHGLAGLAAAAAGRAEQAAAYFRMAAERPWTTGEATFYQALALWQLGNDDEADRLLEGLRQAGESLVRQAGRPDAAAVAAPTLPFEGDRKKRAEGEGAYYQALARIGLGRGDPGRIAEGRRELEAILARTELLGAWIHAGKTGTEVLEIVLGPASGHPEGGAPC